MKTLQNHQPEWSHYRTVSEGISWPDHQIFPSFASLDTPLDTITLSFLSDDMKTTLAALQGHVNRKKPRIFLNGTHAARGEGTDAWPERLNIRRTEWTDLFGFLKKYQSEVDGIVLYNGEYPHMRNLASTAANVCHLIPVERILLPILQSNGITLPVAEDLTTLEFDSAVSLYRYLYDHYWEKCTHRLLFSLDPVKQPAHIRDLAAATKAAVVDLDPRKPEEKECLDLFLQDLPAGNSAVVGWWQEERSGVGEGSRYGVSTIPADYYENATVYAAQPHVMHIPPVPKKPQLENKIYLAVFMSDGDNIQYCQHYLPWLWANPKRGTVPLNWTASPSLVDIGPGIMNYFYDTATENDCICSGPSGLGYALIYDDSNKIMQMDDTKKVDAYTKFSNSYLLKNGMRSLTVWDQLREDQADCYEKNCRSLYGTTIQYPEKDDLVITNGRLPFIRNNPPYAVDLEHMYDALAETIRNFDGKKPLFLAAQGVTWFLTPENMQKMIETFDAMNPGKVVVLRGDHFFTLLNEANGCPFNLALSDKVSVSVNDKKDASVILSGSPYEKNLWQASNVGSREFILDLGEAYTLSRYVIMHAGVNDENTDRNNRDFSFAVSEDGKNWSVVDEQADNSSDVVDVDFPPVCGRYIRLSVTRGGLDEIVRIGDLEIYGARIS